MHIRLLLNFNDEHFAVLRAKNDKRQLILFKKATDKARARVRARETIYFAIKVTPEILYSEDSIFVP